MNQKEKNRIKQAFKEKIDYDELMNCTRCGFCLPSCPTYIETGEDEVHSPRGRIALMKGVVDGIIEPSEEVKRSIDVCLGCRACEPVCPSGVKFGKLLEQARDAVYQTNKKSLPAKAARSLTLKSFFPYTKRIKRATSLLGIYQRSGLQKVVHKTRILKVLPEHLEQMEKVLPNVPKYKEMKYRPDQLSALSEKRKRVAFFSGCLMDSIFMSTNDASMKLLQYAGCDIVIPQTQGCCGALHGHSGELEQAKVMAQKNIEAFEKIDVDYIITNAGGCGAFLHDYDELFENEPEWKERASKFANKIKDISSVLVELNFHKRQLKLDNTIVTYQDSCHLKNVQKTWIEPRQLLEAIDGVDYVEMKDAQRCCGSAGIYNIIEPAMSMQILDYKMKQVNHTKATIIITSNPGCLLQMKLGIEREGLTGKIKAMHIVDFLLQSYEHTHIKQE